MDNNSSFWNSKSGIVGFVIGAIIIVIMVVMIASCGSGPSKYSKLSDQEKDNARWAYQVKEAEENYK